jgi:hypothetical protein
MASITLKVKPAVFRWIDNNFTKQKGKYDVRNSWVHDMVVAGLARVHTNSVGEVSRNFENWKTIELIISGRYATRFGTNLTAENQHRINCALYKMLINEICTGVMHAHVLTGYPKNTMIKNYLSNYFYDENELSLACVSKIYQRKYLDKEKLMREKFT